MEQAILKTLAYFDLFSYPLTLVELSTFLRLDGVEADGSIAEEILTAFNSSENLRSKISYEQGFFYLHGRGELVSRRMRRYNLADKKFKIALRALKVMQLLPSLKSAMICNSLSFNNSSEQSDIDLFLVIAPETLWITRLLMIGLSEFMGVRIHLADSKDKLCLSFLICEGNYGLEKVAIGGGDVYLEYWLATLMPIFGREEYEKLLKENMRLLAELPNFSAKRAAGRRRLGERSSSRFASNFLKIFDGWAKKIQLAKMAPYKLALAQSEGSEVILSNEMLKFHENDRRWLYQQQYINKCQELLN